MLGLLFANLLLASDILRYQNDTTQWAVRLVVYCTFGYLGMMLAMRSNRDEFSLIIPYVRFARETTQHEPLVLDTNVIIDGRIADLVRDRFSQPFVDCAAFCSGRIANAGRFARPIKRERGRRGLDILNELQRSREIDLTIHDTHRRRRSVDRRAPCADGASLLQARLLTNDQALCQVARLQQVTALNLTDLARALRPVATAGDELDLYLVKEGRESHQAVGYLADGTMIVVNHAQRRLATP